MLFEKFQRGILAFLAIAILTLSGCAITPPKTATKGDAVRLECTTSTPVLDGIAVTACAVTAQEVNKETGQNQGMWKRSIQVFNSLPTLGEMAKGIVGGTGAAAIQAHGAKNVAKINTEACKEGGCGNGGSPTNILVQGGVAQARADAGASSGSAANVSGAICGLDCLGAKP